MKQELWAGSPALEKRENFIDQTDSEVIQEFISNQNEKQIVRSLKGLDDKPYLVMFSWQELSVDNTWAFKCVCVNATKYLKERAKEKEKKAIGDFNKKEAQKPKEMVDVKLFLNRTGTPPKPSTKFNSVYDKNYIKNLKK